MSDHDPICEQRLKAYGTYRCTCTEIGEARTDERERIAAAIEAAAIPVVGWSTGLQAHHEALALAARIARNGGQP